MQCLHCVLSLLWKWTPTMQLSRHDSTGRGIPNTNRPHIPHLGFPYNCMDWCDGSIRLSTSKSNTCSINALYLDRHNRRLMESMEWTCPSPPQPNWFSNWRWAGWPITLVLNTPSGCISPIRLFTCQNQLHDVFFHVVEQNLVLLESCETWGALMTKNGLTFTKEILVLRDAFVDIGWMSIKTMILLGTLHQ